MQHRKKFILVFFFTLSVFSSISAQNETVTNETIIELLKDGFTTEDIVGLIENSSTRTVTFSIQYMRELKAAGADSQLIQYLQKISKADFGLEGVLWWNTGDKPKKVYRSQFEREESGTLLTVSVRFSVSTCQRTIRIPSAKRLITGTIAS